MRREKKLRIYLCGSIKKGDSDLRPSNEFWTEEDEITIKSKLNFDVDLLNPAKTKISRNDYFVNFGADLFLVQSSDMIFADLRSEKGIGVGAEMMFARQSGIPVIAWLPERTHYRRDLSDVFGEDLKRWIHPFAFALSDHIAQTLDEVCQIANAIADCNLSSVDSSKNINRAIDRFLENYPEYKIDQS